MRELRKLRVVEETRAARLGSNGREDEDEDCCEDCCEDCYEDCYEDCCRVNGQMTHLNHAITTCDSHNRSSEQASHQIVVA